MKKKHLLLTMLLTLVGAGNLWADEDSEYSAALANITDGSYRIYALNGGTKYYLKAVNPNANESNGAELTTTYADATVFAVSQANVSGVVSKSWKITSGLQFNSKTVYFTNPSMSSGSINNTGYLRVHNRNDTWNYDTQVLYYNGTAYAIRATNATAGKWGEASFWYIYDDSGEKAGYTTDASYIWHFEPVKATIEGGKYKIKGANTSWGNSDTDKAPYWINNGEGVFCLWNDVKQAVTYDVICGEDAIYFYDAVQKRYMTVNESNYWFTSSNSATAIYTGTFDKNGTRYVTLANGVNKVFTSDAAFCTAENRGTHTSTFSQTDNGYNYSLSSGALCKSEDGAYSSGNPNSLWLFESTGSNSSSTVFDLTKLRKGAPGLVAALKTNNQGTVSYTLTIGEAGAATLCLPFNAELPSGVSAYTLTTHSEGKLLATSAASIVAGTPYYIEATAGTYTFTASVSEINTTAPGTTGVLTGTYERTNISSGYILQKQGENVGFYQVNEALNVGAFRAYITAEASARRLNIIFDNATSVNTISRNNHHANAESYNLAGQRIGTQQRGIHIIRMSDGTVRKVLK